MAKQATGADRLGEVGVAAGFKRLLIVAAHGEGGHHDDRNMGDLRIGLDLAGHFQPVQARQLDVHDDQVRTLLGGGGQPLEAVDRLDHLEIGAGQEVAHDAPVVLLILDHQDASAHEASLAGSA